MTETSDKKDDLLEKWETMTLEWSSFYFGHSKCLAYTQWYETTILKDIKPFLRIDFLNDKNFINTEPSSEYAKNKKLSSS